MHQVDWDTALDMADIREAYCKSHKPCPKCSNPQVQLVESQVSHGDWKCRGCGHKWQTTLDYDPLFKKKKEERQRINPPI